MERDEMKQLIKRTCKPKSKKTIRTMTPLARKMARLTQATKSIERRLAYLTEDLYQLERSENAAQAQIKGHALVCPLAHERAPTEHLWPELPNGEGVKAPPGCEVDAPGDGLFLLVELSCACGHPKGTHNADGEICGVIDCKCIQYTPTATDPRD
jgi:hypothetical protein